MNDEEDADDDANPPPSAPDSLLDSWLLQHFPGRFLDEIYEQMDVFRFLRALKARNIENIESLRKRFRDKKIKAEDITSEQWLDIQKHDRIIVQLTTD